MTLLKKTWFHWLQNIVLWNFIVKEIIKKIKFVFKKHQVFKSPVELVYEFLNIFCSCSTQLCTFWRTLSKIWSKDLYPECNPNNFGWIAGNCVLHDKVLKGLASLLRLPQGSLKLRILSIFCSPGDFLTNILVQLLYSLTDFI